MPKLRGRKIRSQDDAELRQDGRQDRRGTSTEILKLVDDKAEMARRRAEAAKVIPELRKIREEIARNSPNQPDSADLIREDRESR